jgi:hypothetical protein
MNAIDFPRLPLAEQSRATIFQGAGSLFVSPCSELPKYDYAPADRLFDEAVSQASSFRPHSKAKKLKHWRVLFYRAAEAIRVSGCLRYSRKNGNGTKAFWNVIECAVECGFFRLEAGKKNGPHMSRLVPLPALRQAVTNVRPLPQINANYVYVREPGTKTRKVANMEHPAAKDRQSKLAVVNDALSRVEITYRTFERFERHTRERLVCAPQHRAVFHSENYDSGGRMYGSRTDGHFSHQSLRSEERETIWFNGRPSVELDYSGFLPRLLYHLEGTGFAGDVYSLHDDTSEAERFLNKLVLNVALNVEDKAKIIAACNFRQSCWTSPRKVRGGKTLPPVRKNGKSLDRARAIQDALRESGLNFLQVHKSVIAAHAPISHHFGTGATMRFQPIESKIALNVIYGFARRGVPCLGVHDSFIVPLEYEAELREAMMRCYYDEVGFLPVIKGGNEIVRQGLAA